MKLGGYFKLCTLIFIGVLAAGCATTRLELSGKQIEKEESAQILTRLTEGRLNVESFRALASLKLDTLVTRGSFRQIWLAKSPDLIRIDTLAPQGAFVVESIVIQGEQIQVQDRVEQVFKDYGGTKQFFRQNFGFEIDPRLFIPLIMAQLPEGYDRIRLNSKGEFVVTDSRGEVYFIFDSHLLNRVILVNRFSRRSRAEVKYLEFSPDNLPSRIQISSDNGELEVGLANIKLNNISDSNASELFALLN